MIDAILITLSQKTIKERRGGIRTIFMEWSNADGEKSTWSYKVGNAPKHEVLWVYWVIGGRVRWRSRILAVHKKKWVRFSNRSTDMFGTWIEMFDFEPIPRKEQFDQKGFQGFRYHESSWD